MSRTIHIAVVDDEAGIRDLVEEYLTKHGFRVSQAANAAALRHLMVRDNDIDLVILDVQMPGEDGFSVARWLREQSAAGVIMLTSSTDTIDRVAGLEVGADDYVPKPFDLRELLARIRSVLRRVAGMDVRPSTPDRIQFGELVLDRAAKTLTTVSGTPIPLTIMEFDLLKAFVESPNRVLSRDQLLDQAHGRGAEPYDRSVDIRINRLRRKIEADPQHPEIIKTVRGAGYVFVPVGLGRC